MRMLVVGVALLGLAGCGNRGHRVPLPPVPTFTPVEREPVEKRTAAPRVVDEPVAPAKPPESAIVPIPRDLVADVGAVNAELVDVYFPYDRSEVTADAMEALRKDAALLAPLLRWFPELEVVVEGHCDERGSAAYNLGLGARRAERAAAVLGTLGLPADRLRTISFGSERPQCAASVESCWRLNRRAHLELRQRPPSSATGVSW